MCFEGVLLAECVFVSATTLQFKGGVGVPQALERTALPFPVLQQARVPLQPPEGAVEAGWLVSRLPNTLEAKPQSFLSRDLVGVIHVFS